MKINCKECHCRHHISKLENAHKEITCYRNECPFMKLEPRTNEALSFDKFPKEEFTVVEVWNTVDLPEMTVEDWANYLDGIPFGTTVIDERDQADSRDISGI